MSTEITLTLRDDVAEQAELLARQTGRSVGEILAETIELSLKPLGETDVHRTRDWTQLPDEDVLSAIEADLSAVESRRLSELLDRRQSEQLTASERSELTALMYQYQQDLLDKAGALREAVHRGLREPPAP